MSGHTPGPWSVTNGHLIRVMAHGNSICGVHKRGISGPMYDEAEVLANARLIAAAPETAAALERTRKDIAELVYAAKGGNALKGNVKALRHAADELKRLGSTDQPFISALRQRAAMLEGALAKHARAQGSQITDAERLERAQRAAETTTCKLPIGGPPNKPPETSHGN